MTPTQVVMHSAGLQRTWAGINAYTETVAERNTFTPPDQGLCVGRGYTLETANKAIRVYSTAGRPLSATVGTNSFYRLPPIYNPSIGRHGSFPADHSCVDDAGTGRFFVSAVALEVNPAHGKGAARALASDDHPPGPRPVCGGPTMNGSEAGTAHLLLLLGDPSDHA